MPERDNGSPARLRLGGGRVRRGGGVGCPVQRAGQRSRIDSGGDHFGSRIAVTSGAMIAIFIPAAP
ncbi:MAG: hypothetical protein JO345_19875 [Streptosporangiaceae bacterium]|nr:hypothetical protein [Streptosporangiaceae bacterium]